MTSIAQLPRVARPLGRFVVVVVAMLGLIATGCSIDSKEYVETSSAAAGVALGSPDEALAFAETESSGVGAAEPAVAPPDPSERERLDSPDAAELTELPLATPTPKARVVTTTIRPTSVPRPTPGLPTPSPTPEVADLAGDSELPTLTPTVTPTPIALTFPTVVASPTETSDPTTTPDGTPTTQPTNTPEPTTSTQPTVTPPTPAEVSTPVPTATSLPPSPTPLPSATPTAAVTEPTTEPCPQQSVTETDQITSLPRAEQLSIAREVIDCFGVESFAIEAMTGIDLGSEIANLEFVAQQSGTPLACLGPGLLNAPRGMAILGFVALSTGEAVAAPDRTTTAELLSECSPPSGLVGPLTSALVPDAPEFVQGIDATCAAVAYQEPGAASTFWNELITGPGVSVLGGLPRDGLLKVFGPIIDCMSLGTVIVNDAAANGVPVPPTTVLCIDEAIAGTDLLIDLFTGTLDPNDASISAILIACLSGE